MRQQHLKSAIFGGTILLLPVWTLAAPPIVIQNATVLTVTKGTIDKGSVLVRDGKIAEVGANLRVPAGATLIDASGQYLMPGIIDCHSHIIAEAINEGTVSVSSMVGIGDVLNPEDIAIYRALAGGVTTANILHGSANSIGGKCVVVKTRWGNPQLNCCLKEPCRASNSPWARIPSAADRRLPLVLLPPRLRRDIPRLAWASKP